MIRVILVRHGATAWNLDRRYMGQTDIALSDEGRRQAERLASRLAHEPITLAYSSDLSRAQETADIALRGRPVEVRTDPALREIRFGAWEGLGHDDIARQYPREWASWVENPARGRPPGGGESLVELRERIVARYCEVVATETSPSVGAGKNDGPRDRFSYRAAGARVANDGSAILVVSHGGAIRVLLTHVFDMAVDLYWRFGVRPASVTILEVYPEGAIAEVIGDTSHL